MCRNKIITDFLFTPPPLEDFRHRLLVGLASVTGRSGVAVPFAMTTRPIGFPGTVERPFIDSLGAPEIFEFRRRQRTAFAARQCPNGIRTEHERSPIFFHRLFTHAHFIITAAAIAVIITGRALITSINYVRRRPRTVFIVGVGPRSYYYAGHTGRVWPAKRFRFWSFFRTFRLPGRRGRAS